MRSKQTSEWPNSYVPITILVDLNHRAFSHFSGEFRGDVEAFLLADILQDGDDVFLRRCGDSDSQASRPDGGNHFGCGIGAQNHATRGSVLLHRPTQSVLSVFRQAEEREMTS